MDPRSNRLFTRELLFLLLIIAILAGALLWTSHLRVVEFIEHEQRHVEISVRGAANAISAELHGLQRAAGLFAAKETALLEAFARDPDNDRLYQTLIEQVRAAFPEAFAVTLADETGTPLRTDIEGLVGEVCQADIKSFVRHGGATNTHIHPNPDTYHFDIMAPVQGPDGTSWVFFVSFRPDILVRVLNNSAIYGHELLLLRRDADGLIEVGAQGARDRLKREFRLSAVESGRIMNSVAIDGTLWNVVDLPDALIANQFARHQWTLSGVVLAVLALFSALVVRNMLRANRRQRDYTVKLERTARQLCDSGARIQAILDTVTDGIITINERGVVESFNAAAERMFGYTAEEVIGSNVSMLMPEPYRDRLDSYLERYVQTNERGIIGIGREVEALRKDGSLFPMELSVGEMHLGGERRYTGVVRDITRRRRLERVKNEFVSTVSHELRTPLTSIRGSLGLLASGVMGALTPNVRQMVDISLKNCERLIVLINDILDIDKLESGQMRFAVQPVDLLPLLRQAMEANQAYAEQYAVGFELSAGVGVGGIWVMADAERLMQVLANLMSNACKFSPPQGVVRLSLERTETGHARVTVADQGAGIAEAFRDHIFQKFAQADASDTRQVGGTGLGLSISKAIIERLDGRIGYDSLPGQGARFHFELPCVPPPQDGAGVAQR